jgi:hypothetical protein
VWDKWRLASTRKVFSVFENIFPAIDQVSIRSRIKAARPYPKTLVSAPVNLPLPHTVRGSVGTPTLLHSGEFTSALRL